MRAIRNDDPQLILSLIRAGVNLDIQRRPLRWDGGRWDRVGSDEEGSPPSGRARSERQLGQAALAISVIEIEPQLESRKD